MQYRVLTRNAFLVGVRRRMGAVEVHGFVLRGSGHRKPVICQIHAVECSGFQTDGHTGRSAAAATAERRLPVHIVRAAHTESGRVRWWLFDQ